MSDNFSSTSSKGTLDARIENIHSSLSFSIDDFDVEELLKMTPEELGLQAEHLAQAVDNNPVAHGALAVPTSAPDPRRSNLSLLSQAASSLASRGGEGGNNTRQVDLYDQEDQGSLNPGVYTAWRNGVPLDRELLTPEPMYLEPTATTIYPPTPPECLTFPPELEDMGPGTSDQALVEKDETTALGRRKRKLVMRPSILAKACGSKALSDGDVGMESCSEDSQMKRGKSELDAAEAHRRKILRQRQARRRKSKMAAKGRLIDASRKLRQELGMVNLIQGEVECPGCGTTVILKASMDKMNEEEKADVDLVVD